MHKGKRPDSSHGGRLAEGLAPNVWEGLQGPTFTSEEGLQKVLLLTYGGKLIGALLLHMGEGLQNVLLSMHGRGLRGAYFHTYGKAYGMSYSQTMRKA
ncbi:hypothetical protein GOBAR_AA11385 [Gossypium barbadense]|uniref:Uncharacterized protein n=1 Tax=Gossypium barbadense TaxID=3634 RepID=A0A2P5Y0Z3_GOSBA|nr:hypothetical protein GOBAR_AA11385 [Gossypium barbadense]